MILLLAFWAQRGPDRAPPDVDLRADFARGLEQLHFDQVRERVAEDDVYVTLSTWYLSSMNGRECRVSRQVHLGPDRSQWRQRLLHVWRDRIDPDFPFEFHHVFPEPPRNADEDHAGHVLILQHTMMEHRGCLVARQILDRPYQHFAVMGPLILTKYKAIFMAGLQNWCYRGWLRHRCVISSDWDGVEDDSPRPCVHGFSFK